LPVKRNFCVNAFFAVAFLVDLLVMSTGSSRSLWLFVRFWSLALALSRLGLTRHRHQQIVAPIPRRRWSNRTLCFQLFRPSTLKSEIKLVENYLLQVF